MLKVSTIHQDSLSQFHDETLQKYNAIDFHYTYNYELTFRFLNYRTRPCKKLP